MGFYNDYFAAFFFEPFVTDNKPWNFYLALLFVFLHMFLYTFISNVYKGNLILKVTGPFFMFFNMFLIMCYNRWIIIIYIIAETLGYTTFRLVTDEKIQKKVI